MSFIDVVAGAPADPIFALTATCKADTSPLKVDLGVGAYRDEHGKPWVLPTVKKAEAVILKQLEAGEINHEYLPIGGDAQFVKCSAAFAMGKASAAIAEGRVMGCQTISGTGALRIAFEFLAQHNPCKDILISDPTWGNHKAIAGRAKLNAISYRYYNKADRGLDFDGFLADLNAAQPGSTVLLHACAHNPTGVDPSIEQWKQLAAVVKEKGLFALFDSAYQGFASGDPAVDAASIRLFAEEKIPLMVCQSYSKNFGLYNERAGCLLVCCATPEVAVNVTSQLKILIRAAYSNPPAHGAQIVATVLSNPELEASFYADLQTMSGRIKECRTGLLAALVERKTPGTWDHITKHIGMFTFTGLTPQQVDVMVEKHHVYMLRNGRISMCGLSERTIPLLADAIDDVVRNVPAKL